MKKETKQEQAGLLLQSSDFCIISKAALLLKKHEWSSAQPLFWEVSSGPDLDACCLFWNTALFLIVRLRLFWVRKISCGYGVLNWRNRKLSQTHATGDGPLTRRLFWPLWNPGKGASVVVTHAREMSGSFLSGAFIKLESILSWKGTSRIISPVSGFQETGWDSLGHKRGPNYASGIPVHLCEWDWHLQKTTLPAGIGTSLGQE